MPNTMPSATAPATMMAGMRKTASATTSGGDEGVECGAPRGSAAHGEEIEERADRDGGGQRGEDRDSPGDRSFAARAGSLDLEED